MLSAGQIPHNSIHLLIITTDFVTFTDFTGYVVFIITSFLAGVESADQCLLNSEVLSCFSGVIMSVRSFFLFVREFPQFSGGCRDWIDWLIHEQNIEIQSAFHGRERKIGPYRVDGFCSELNTVFEFYGDYWHCHPDQFPDENVVHPTVKNKDNNPMTVKDIHARDQQRVRDLQDKGHTVEIIWENDWEAHVTQRPEIKAYISQHHTHTHFKKYPKPRSNY